MRQNWFRSILRSLSLDRRHSLVETFVELLLADAFLVYGKETSADSVQSPLDLVKVLNPFALDHLMKNRGHRFREVVDVLALLDLNMEERAAQDGFTTDSCTSHYKGPNAIRKRGVS